MFKNYLVLCGLVIAVIVALATIGSLFSLFEARGEEKLLLTTRNIQLRKIRNWIILVIGAVALIATIAGYKSYQYLITEAPAVIETFGVWYLVGFVSRLPLLVYRGYLFHHFFDTEWDEVFGTFFTALIGPFQILFTIYGIWNWKRMP